MAADALAIEALATLSCAGPVCYRPESLPVRAGPIGVAKPLLEVRVVVTRPSSMLRIMPPVFDACTAVDIDGSATPVDAVAAPKTAAAPISVGCPSPECIGRAKSDTRGDEPGADVAWISPVVGVSRIIRIRPITEDYLRFIIRHVQGIRHNGLDINSLPVLLLLTVTICCLVVASFFLS